MSSEFFGRFLYDLFEKKILCVQNSYKMRMETMQSHFLKFISQNNLDEPLKTTLLGACKTVATFSSYLSQNREFLKQSTENKTEFCLNEVYVDQFLRKKNLKTENGDEKNFRKLTYVGKGTIFKEYIYKYKDIVNSILYTQDIYLEYKFCEHSKKVCFVLKTLRENFKIKYIFVQRDDNGALKKIDTSIMDLVFYVDKNCLFSNVDIKICVVHNNISDDSAIFNCDSFKFKYFNLKTPDQEFIYEMAPYILEDFNTLCYKKEEQQIKYLCQISPKFKSYITNGKKLTQENMCEVLKYLLTLEDLEILKPYNNLIQYNVLMNSRNLERYMDEDNVFEWKYTLEVPAGYNNNNNNNKPCDLLSAMNESKFYGIVLTVSKDKVTFTIKSKEKTPEICFDSAMYTIVFGPSRFTIRLQYRALDLLSKERIENIDRILFPTGVDPIYATPLKKLVLLNESIYENPEQLQAVRTIAVGPKCKAPYIIFGPPGTGKTTLIVECILQLYLHRPDTKILVTAASNTACDEIAVRLCKALFHYNDEFSIVRLYARSFKKEISFLLKEHSNIHSKYFCPNKNDIKKYRIVISTLSVIGKLDVQKPKSSLLEENKISASITHFTHIFIDEAAATTEAETLLAIIGLLPTNASLILSGDHKQLGAVLQSKAAEYLGFSTSLMERILKSECYRVHHNGDYNRSFQTRLRRNYRSHPKIVNLFNHLFYNNQLLPLAKENVELICKIWPKLPNSKYPILFHSVDGIAETENNSTSIYNWREIDVVIDYVKDLLKINSKDVKITVDDIGIISPYKLQYLKIKNALADHDLSKITIGSPETFQGSEKPIIIVSFVRSKTRALGFLTNEKRLNVTISRPKSLLILIGNAETLKINSNFKFIIDSCIAHKSFITSSFAKKPDTLDELLKNLEI